MKSYCYQINLGSYGAELIAGNLNLYQFKFWSCQSTQDLVDTLLGVKNQDNIPTSARLRSYSEMNDIRHLWGAWYEERTNIWIIDLKNEYEILNSELGSLPDSSTSVVNHPQIESPSVIFESEEKGGFTVNLELDEPFELSKLVVVGEHFYNGYGVVTHITYDGLDYYLEGNTRGVSVNAILV